MCFNPLQKKKRINKPLFLFSERTILIEKFTQTNQIPLIVSVFVDIFFLYANEPCNCMIFSFFHKIKNKNRTV